MSNLRSSFTEARKGQRAYRSRGTQNQVVSDLKYDVNTVKRVIVPLVDGQMVVFSAPIHKVLNYNVKMPKTNGNGVYTVNEIRCTHVNAQTSDVDSLAIAESKEMCVFCELAKLENRQQWDKINAEYGEDFRNLSKDEKKAIFNSIQKTHTVESSFKTSQDEEGNTLLSTTTKNYILLLEVETSSADGKTIKRNSDGSPIITPVLLPTTATRLEKFKSAVDMTMDVGGLAYENLHPIIENEGTDLEEEVLLGWVEFLLKFPDAPKKAESAKNLNVVALPHNQSIVNEEFIQEMTEKMVTFEKDAEFTVSNVYKNLKILPRQDVIQFINDREDENGNVISGEEYFDNLRAKYRKETVEEGATYLSDTDHEAKLFDQVIERLGKKEEDKAETETETETTVEEEKHVEVQEEVEVEVEEKKPAKRGRKPKAVEETEEIEDDEFPDDVFDEI